MTTLGAAHVVFVLVVIPLPVFAVFALTRLAAAPTPAAPDLLVVLLALSPVLVAGAVAALALCRSPGRRERGEGMAAGEPVETRMRVGRGMRHGS